MRIAHNLVIDHFRKNSRMPKFDNAGEFSIFSVLSDSSLNAEKSMIKDQVESDVRRVIEELPEDQKQECRDYFDNHSFQEFLDFNQNQHEQESVLSGDTEYSENL